MDIQTEKNHIFNIRLAKLIGLYQALDPGTVKCRGQNVYHIFMAFIFLYMCGTSIILNLCCLCYWKDNMPLNIDYFWKVETSFIAIYRIWIVVCHSNDIWNCMAITRYGFTLFSHQSRHILDYWRERSVWLTTVYAFIYSLSLVFFVCSTLVFSKNILPVKSHDGSIGYYRQNIMNLYSIVSDETYNAHYTTFYIVETLYLFCLAIAFIIFDLLLVTLCFALCCQMQVICSAFESVGHKSLHDRHSSIENPNEKKIVSNEQDLIYNDLKSIIIDHQRVMKIYQDFLTIFGRSMLFQIFFSSLSLIILWFIFIMSFSDDDRFTTSGAVLKKMMASIPALWFQLFMLCYLFEHLHEKNESIIFSLYSSNWTEMDMKCKKLILLTMKMNNANFKKLKFTRTKIVNLELFFKTMSNCYSILSVLVNYMKTK